MADNAMSGMDMLSKLVGDLGTRTRGSRVDNAIVKSCVSREYPSVGFGAFLGEVADKIEREQNDAVCALKQRNRELQKELDAAKRDLTDEAREAVERLRALKHSGYDWRWTAVNKAIGIEGNGVTPENRWSNTIDRLCDLVERGGKQDVDVAALRELVKRIKDANKKTVKIKTVSPCSYFGKREYNCGGCQALSGGCYTIMLDDIAERIRKAIEGAQAAMPSAEEAGIASIGANVRQCEREAAADRVEAHGGLENVKGIEKDCVELQNAHMALGETLVILGCDPDEVDRAKSGKHCEIAESLAKRLMPEGMEWPTNASGEKLAFGMEFTAPEYGIKEPRAITRICLFSPSHFEDGASGSLCEINYLRTDNPGYRVERPAPEVLDGRREMSGALKYADGQPVSVGDEFQRLRFVGWAGKKFTVDAIVGDEIVYMTSNIGAGSVRPEECIKFDQSLHERIRELVDEHLLSCWDVEPFVLSLIGERARRGE